MVRNDGWMKERVVSDEGTRVGKDYNVHRSDTDAFPLFFTFGFYIC